MIHVRTFGATKTGHTRFSVSAGMRVAGEAGREAQVGARKIHIAGHGEADVGIADVTLVDDEAAPVRIVAPAHGDVVEDQRLALPVEGGEDRPCRRRRP